MYVDLPRPTIFAHRGASAHAPENTLAAFQLAVHMGADAIELDTKLSLDGHAVVIHDQTIDRTTGGHGTIREMTLAAIRDLDAGSHFDPRFRGEPIPTLSEVLEAMRGLQFINIELTNYASLFDDLPNVVAGLVKKHAMASQIMFSSFNPIALLRVKRLLPDAPVGLLALRGERGKWARSRLGGLIKYQALHPAFGDATSNMVDSLHRQGKRVHVYTVNQPEDMHRMFMLNVDGIITDDPALARRVHESIRA